MGRPRKNEPGDRYGRWTLISHVDRRHWLCRCDCGTVRSVRTDSLTKGQTKSCGCDAKRLQHIAKIEQGPHKDLTGKRFGKLKVLSYAGSSKWNCICDCGKRTTVKTGALNFGVTQSCGCKNKETRFTSETATTHGMSAEKIYGVWRGMKQRCGNPNDRSYKWYGGRGISVCEEWRNSFETFYDYVCKLPNYGEPGRTIDRIDVNGNYCPGNVRWATWSEQAANKQSSRKEHYGDQEKGTTS